MDLTPDISVIVVAGDRIDRAAWALEGIAEQGDAGRVEILVPLYATAEAALPPQLLERVRLVPTPPGTSSREARAMAVRLAAAPIVAFVEEHCRLMPGWVDAILGRMEDGWAGAGGEVHSANPEEGIGHLSAIVAYPFALPPVTGGETAMIASPALAFRRELLIGYAEELGSVMGTDGGLQMLLAKDGHRFAVEPAARALHIDLVTTRSLIEGTWFYNRLLGHQRASIGRWSLARRLAHAATLPLLPWVRTARLLAYIARHKRPHLRAALAGVHVMLLCHASAHGGQVAGMLFGTGRAVEQYSDFEINVSRDLVHPS